MIASRLLREILEDLGGYEHGFGGRFRMRLSGAELEVRRRVELDLRKEGLTLQAIGERMRVCQSTVRYDLFSVYRENQKQSQTKRREKVRNDIKLREERNQVSRDWKRKNNLSTIINGKHVALRVNKRSRPNSCELCGKTAKLLFYHHWDSEQPELGIWLCSDKCHSFAEAVDEGYMDKYLQKYLTLKQEIKGGLLPSLENLGG